MSDLKRYLGDSVYINFVSGKYVLTTENGLPSDPSNEIILEHEVIWLLLKYVDYIGELIEEYRSEGEN